MSELTIWFGGICVHFRHTVPGVPLRTVLPNTMGVHFGGVVPPGNERVAYYLMPHVPLLTATDPKRPFMRWLTGAHLQITNAIVDKTTPIRFGDGGYSISDYVANFAFSEDVVFGGRASCYFDIFGGDVTPTQMKPGAWVTKVTIRTDGPPELQITPFAGSAMAPERMTLHGGELLVTNTDLMPKEDDKPFDFLLHYLVARGGIPDVLETLTPGMTPPLPPLTLDELSRKLEDLAKRFATLGGESNDFQTAMATAVGAVDLTQSCSDSHYP